MTSAKCPVRGVKPSPVRPEAFARLSTFTETWFPNTVHTATTPDTGGRQGLNLALATWVSAINFWAWNLIGPLSTTYAKQMSLSSTETSLLVATPILVGALGRSRTSRRRWA